MAARVLVDAEATDRLTEMGLTVANIERPIRLAEAEAATCTALDPPVTTGFMRYARIVRFLREELLPMGWEWDNPRNFCRTIHPARQFAIVATSGDEATGDPKLVPTTKYPKGYATASAVDMNGQLAFDFSDSGIADELRAGEQLATWILLYHVTETEIHAELSLPSEMTGGNISDWQERIILPSFPLEDVPIGGAGEPDDGDDHGEYEVEVNRR